MVGTFHLLLIIIETFLFLILDKHLTCSQDDSNELFSSNKECLERVKILEERIINLEAVPKELRGSRDSKLRQDSSAVKNAVACHGSNLVIGCEPEYVISVLRANYGRKSRKCNMGGSAPILTEHCFAVNSKTIVDNYCSGKQTCSIPALHTIFGDPCVGTYKYLQVDYQCIPKPPTKNEVACHGSNLVIGCEPEYVISILRANYGRKSKKCNMNGSAPIRTEYCFAVNSKTIVDNYCSGKQNCSIPALHTIFGDPCVGTYKYLDVDYQCIPDYVPESQSQNEDNSVDVRENVTEKGNIDLKCRVKLGTKPYTLEIETPDEWNLIDSQHTSSHRCSGCTRNFWTIGESGKNLVIAFNDKTVQTENATVNENFKYICEVPTTASTTKTTYTPNTQPPPSNPTPVELCYNDNDLIVLLDSSVSIGSSDYKKAKVFVYDLARSFEGVVTSRFGFTIFASAVLKVAPLTNTFTPTELNTKILNADFMASMTNTNLAIDSAVVEFEATPRSVPQNLVVITDGASNNKIATRNSIDAAINAGMRTFSVGIGSATNYAELLAIAGGNSNRMFNASNFDELAALVNPISRAICQ